MLGLFSVGVGGGGGALQIHFVNSCRPHPDCAVTDDRKDRRFETDIFLILILSEQVLGTQIKLISRAPAIQDPSLKGNLVDVCVQIPVDSHVKNVPWITSATIN